MAISMKHKMFVFTLLVLVGYITNAQPVITFEKTTQHLGFVRQGDTLNFEYKFTNTGNQPLIISDTKVECGCTVVDKPSNPISPGKQGIINVTFHTNSAIDRQDRTVTVFSNASNSPTTLRFKCVVLKAKKT
jgi:Protein of unknown function (DUF1573)